MAKQKSDNSRYESSYGGGWVSSAQYIAEVISARLAKKNKKDLPDNFWNLPTHKRGYMMNLLAANSLLKIYSPKAVIAAIRQAPNLYSLRAPWLDDLIKVEQQKLDSFVEKVEANPTSSLPADINITETPRASFNNKKSTLSKLRDLDG